VRILVADDDPKVRLLLVSHLEAGGHAVHTVVDGTAALAAVRQDAPDALVLDVMMPGLTGWEVLQALRAENLVAGLPVVLVSGRDLLADQRHGYELGASLVLSKSDDFSKLAGTLEALHASAVERRSQEE
jgi:CheY-like chemotaxis protein